jgi:uncharacterized protein (DUF2126 family)
MDWMEEVAATAESRLAAADIRLTLGGEPTMVPLEPSGAEWSISADGPTKLPLARNLARELQRQVWPGSTLLYCPGKRYDGEVNPRWALRLITGLDGTPPVRWPEACQPGLEGGALRPEQAGAWLERLGERLGVTLQPLALVDPLDPDRHVWAVPLTVTDTAPYRWQAGAWPLEAPLCTLSGAPGPAGLRLPLQHFPDELPRQVLTLELEANGWELFLPPLLREPLLILLQAVADGLPAGLAAPRLSGMLPADGEGHWQVLGLTADPGVLEINLPICHGWADYSGWMRRLEQIGLSQGLRSWKFSPAGRREGTGGGNHLLWGGPSLDDHPFFSRPAWLAGVLRYWQHHPSLGYLFGGDCVGPASQSPRPDEAAGDGFELELAYRALEQADGQPSQEAWGDHRGLIGETLRHLHADRSGNNHRSEISFDKFWNPGTPAGCLGLIEFRALESLPEVEWSNAIALLWSALAAHLLEPRHRPRALRDWGPGLHDRMMLPSQLWADLEQVLADLAADGLTLGPAPYRALWEWRFPPLLQWRDQAGDTEEQAVLELRPALEAWPLICDFPREGGFTSRFIDASLRRFEVVANAAFRRRWQLRLNGRPLPLAETPALLAVRFRQQRLYPCFHPAIAPQLPLELDLIGPSGCQRLRLDEPGHAFLPLPETGLEPGPAGPAWSGRRRPDDVTFDLRLP